MNNVPVISIVMPAYNAEKYIDKAIQSLLKQTFKDWECIIVDDGSTDNTHQIIKSIKDSRFRIFRFEKNRGQAATRQFALDNARGSYLAMLDSDDWMYSGRLNHQFKIMQEHPDLCLVSTLKAVTNEYDELVGIGNNPSDYILNKIHPPLEGVKVPIVHAASLIDMEIAKDCSYKAHLKRSEDSDFLRQVLYKGEWMVSGKVTYVHRYLSNPSFKKAFKSYWFEIIALTHSVHAYPLSAFKQIFFSICKTLVITTAGLFGKLKFLQSVTQWRSPKDHEKDEFNNEYKYNFG